MHFVEVPTEVLADCQATGLPPVSYRHVAFRWWLRQARNTATYRYAGIIDTDLIFQLDPFSVMHPFVRTEHELHVISENPVLHNGETVGAVTSGSWSPTLGKAIALALVPTELAQVGNELGVQIRGQVQPATVVKRPFYRRG